METLKAIKNYWLEQIPENKFEYNKVRYMIYDATYFHKDGCMMNLMNGTDQKIIAHLYIRKESFQEAYPWFCQLRKQGLNPDFITTDGERSILRAMRIVWPETKMQRCLYHLRHEGMRWLRTYPKTEAGRQLRMLLSQLNFIKTTTGRDIFIAEYKAWLIKYKDYVSALSRSTIEYKDLKRTIVLINNALPDMFYYLHDNNVHSTTNALEGFHSRLKAAYRHHRGLTKEHRINYISWYCYFKNRDN